MRWNSIGLQRSASRGLARLSTRAISWYKTATVALWSTESHSSRGTRSERTRIRRTCSGVPDEVEAALAAAAPPWVGPLCSQALKVGMPWQRNLAGAPVHLELGPCGATTGGSGQPLPAGSDHSSSKWLPTIGVPSLASTPGRPPHCSQRRRSGHPCCSRAACPGGQASSTPASDPQSDAKDTVRLRSSRSTATLAWAPERRGIRRSVSWIRTQTAGLPRDRMLICRSLRQLTQRLS
mmetsp:Transcript_18078/g.52656  ORF Transcript_18078/g.52656 Transcript_18078/m.52656 type:complete len:237 (+) Transcript_18078:2366-3076(+)